MSARIPDPRTVRSALELAVAAPSIHNTQPWRWRVGERSVHLYADTSRWLPATDPDERDLLVSCGAALHHARVALAAAGFGTKVHRLPNPAEPAHLAALELVTRDPTDSDLALAAAIGRRRADRRPYGSWPVPDSRIAELAAAAADEGVVLRAVGDSPARSVLCAAIAAADRAQRADPRYATELAMWSGRSHGAQDGVPAANVPGAGSYADLPLRSFGHGGNPPPAEEVDDGGGAGELLLLGTASDDRLSRLRAGEATSAVLLRATGDGMATCPLTQPLEVEHSRAAVASVLGDDLRPQMLIRIGWPHPSSTPPERTPRRSVEDVVDFL